MSFAKQNAVHSKTTYNPSKMTFGSAADAAVFVAFDRQAWTF
jgi:hypothetical protein